MAEYDDYVHKYKSVSNIVLDKCKRNNNRARTIERYRKIILKMDLFLFKDQEVVMIKLKSLSTNMKP